MTLPVTARTRAPVQEEPPAYHRGRPIPRHEWLDTLRANPGTFFRVEWHEHSKVAASRAAAIRTQLKRRGLGRQVEVHAGTRQPGDSGIWARYLDPSARTAAA